MSASRPSRIVETPSGPVQGTTYEFKDGHSGSAFLGIPFGKPPVGDLRFKKPVPIGKWTEVKDCTKFAKQFPCIPPFPGETVDASEDGLYLNVFVPEVAKDQTLKDLPVFFYIHGGGFVLCGDAEKLGADSIVQYLALKGVIVVTIAYRVGILGFLTLNNDEVKGNYGLWDMALALKWTKENIASFGGNPNNITVSGQSAGGVAADLLGLSPVTRDLFDKLIIFAGTSHCEFLYMDNELIQKVMVEYAKHLGAQITGKTTEEINKQVLEFYKQADANSIGIGINPNPEFKFYPDLTLPLGPSYDKEFFPKSLDELRKEAPKKKVINGLTEHEGLLFTTTKVMRPDLKTYEQVVNNALRSIRPDLSSEINQKLVKEAIGSDENIESPEHILKCVEAISHFMLDAGALEMAVSRVENGGEVYNFTFSYYRKGTLGPLSMFLPFEAATHCMELPYLFGKSLFRHFEVTDEDHEVMDRFSTYLISFMKTGSPNNDKYPEKWEQFKIGQGDPHFVFGQNEFGTQKNFAGGDQSRYWIQIFKKHPRKSHI